MMDIYSLQRLAHKEHELMVRSLPTVYDFYNPVQPVPSRWSRLLARVRNIGWPASNFRQRLEIFLPDTLFAPDKGHMSPLSTNEMNREVYKGKSS